MIKKGGKEIKKRLQSQANIFSGLLHILVVQAAAVEAGAF